MLGNDTTAEANITIVEHGVLAWSNAGVGRG